MDNETQITQNGVQEASPTSTESDSAGTPASSGSESGAPSPQQQETKQPEAPFHEHPRFREIIDQNKGYRSELETLKKQLAEISANRSQPQQNKPDIHPFVQELEKINPEYAKYIQGLEQKVSRIDSLDSKLSQWENMSMRDKYEASVSKMLDENKVSAPLKAVYKELLDAKALSGQYTLNDLSRVFSDIHSTVSGALDAQKKEAISSYVKDKSKSASIPVSGAKTPAITKKAEAWKPSGDQEKDIRDIARMAVENANAKRSASN